MTDDINEVHVVGELDETPELRTTRSGTKVANPTVVTRRGWTGKDGTERKATEYHRIVTWGGLAEKAAETPEGARVEVTGRLQTRKWETDDGHTRYTTEINADAFEVVETGEGEEFSEEALLGADDDSDLPF